MIATSLRPVRDIPPRDVIRGVRAAVIYEYRFGRLPSDLPESVRAYLDGAGQGVLLHALTDLDSALAELEEGTVIRPNFLQWVIQRVLWWT